MLSWKLGKYFIEIIDDCGENKGGYFCRIYDNEKCFNSGDGYIDEHCVTQKDLNEYGDLETALSYYLNI